jgi:hypothetical protein
LSAAQHLLERRLDVTHDRFGGRLDLGVRVQGHAQILGHARQRRDHFVDQRRDCAAFEDQATATQSVMAERNQHLRALQVGAPGTEAQHRLPARAFRAGQA